MALSVRLTSDSTPAISYRLQAESFVVNYARGPVQAPVPGALPLLIDLGQYRPTITIVGTVDATGTTDGGVDVPTQNELEDFVSGTGGTPAIYASTITATVVIGGVTNTYECKITSCSFSLAAARAELWEFRLQMIVGQTP